jgi:D-alanyl-D-alanine carboxypeptidase/D-alanyl-D-alanine-endopeptidase (penicillin-binding protein 4)
MRTRTVAALAATGALVLGVGALDAADVLPWPDVLTTDEPWAQPAPFPTVTLEPAPSAPPVLPDLDAGAPVPDRDRLAALTAGLLADPRLGQDPGVVVLDALSGEVLLDADGSRPRTPASTVKLLTCSAALAALGEDARLRTRTAWGPVEDEQVPTVYLVGAGDVLLAAGAGEDGSVVGRAGLGDLATATAAALAAEGVARVRLALDDSLFTGPATAPGWGPIDLLGGFVAPVSPLAVDRGKVGGGGGPRAADPAMSAARAFAGALSAAGVAVEGEVTRGAAPGDAEDLAGVESATVGELVTHTLRESDNDVAEALARLVAVAAGRPADFDHATAAVLTTLEGLGLDVGGVRMVDGSGLSEDSAVPPLVLARLVAAVADPARPGLVTVATGMPVAGLLGTLEDRFALDDAAAGVLRAKTGTLLTVLGLAGTVLDADGRLLAFAVAADDLPRGGVAEARAAVDAWLSELAACGCAAADAATPG